MMVFFLLNQLISYQGFVCEGIDSQFQVVMEVAMPFQIVLGKLFTNAERKHRGISEQGEFLSSNY